MNNIFNDISSIYIEEVLKPQLGQDKPSPAGEKSDEQGSGDDGSAKRIRQAVYDIRYRARREDIPLDQAFNQYMSHTSMNAVEKTSVKEKLGIGAGAAGPVKEEASGSKKFQVRVSDKLSGKSYVRMATREKINKLRANKNISSVEMTKYGKPYEGETESGEQTAKVTSGKGLAKKDFDNDGKVETPAKEYRGSVHNAIQRKRGGKPDGQDTSSVKESFSNWREDLKEIVDDNLAAQKKSEIKEKKVDNSSIIKINPVFQEAVENLGGQLIDIREMSEDFLIETVDIATEYFYNHGLNEYGLDLVIEDLGLEKFSDFVFYVAEDYVLSEARAGGVKVDPVTKSGKSVGSLKGGAKTAAIKRLRAEKQARKESEAKASSAKQSGMTAALKSQSSVAKKITTDKGKTAVEKAKESQGSKKPVRDAIARGIFGAVKAYQAGMERHKKAMNLAKETGKTVAKAASVGSKAASEFGKGVASGVKATTKVAKDTHKVLKNSYDMEEELHPNIQKIDAINKERVAQRAKKAEEERQRAKESAVQFQAFKKKHIEGGGTPVSALDAWQKRKLQNAHFEMEGSVLDEKAESEQQQKLFGLALSVKRGQTSRSEASPEVLKIVDGMSEKKIRDFAKTSHKGIPNKVEEALVQANQVQQQQQNTQDLQQQQKQKNLQRQQQQRQQQQKQKPQNNSAVNAVLNARRNVDVAQQKYAAAQKAAASKVNLASLSASYQPNGEMTEARGDWYSGRGTYRTTASGRKVRWDEPSVEREDEINSQIQASLAKKKAQAGKARLKAKGAVPTKDGKPVFENLRRNPK